MGKKGFNQKMFFVITGLACAALVLGGSWAGAEEKIKGPLYIESWGGSYAEAVKKFIIEPFQDKYGIEVKHSFFGSNSEQFAKWKAGKADIDISFMSDSYVYQAIKDGFVQPIRVENVPNYKSLFDKFKNPPYDPGPDVYCISYFWGDQGIAWNTKKVDKPVSWAALWDKQYKGRTAFYSGPEANIPIVAIFLGQDPNNITDLDAVEAKMKELRPNLLKFWSGGAELTSLFATGEVYVADFWRGRVNNLKKEGHPIGYTQPKEGSVGWVDTMVIVKNAKHRRAAEAFLDIALSKEVHTKFLLEGINYAPCSKLVELTEDQIELLGASPVLLKNTYFMNPVYVFEQRDKWNEVTNRVMAGD